jgi:hypothetical protein
VFLALTSFLCPSFSPPWMSFPCALPPESALRTWRERGSFLPSWSLVGIWKRVAVLRRLAMERSWCWPPFTSEALGFLCIPSCGSCSSTMGWSCRTSNQTRSSTYRASSRYVRRTLAWSLTGSCGRICSVHG